MTVLGLLSGLLTTVCWVPQLVRSLRTRRTDDLGWAYLSVLAIGVGLWLSYGILRADLAIVLSNMFTLASVLTLIAIKSTTPKEAE
jgi:MtN3 and saliva related transmembrane protein